MATVEEVRADQSQWEDKDVVVTLKTGEKVQGKLNPSMGGFNLGSNYLDDSEVTNIALRGAAGAGGAKPPAVQNVKDLPQDILQLVAVARRTRAATSERVVAVLGWLAPQFSEGNPLRVQLETLLAAAPGL